MLTVRDPDRPHVVDSRPRIDHTWLITVWKSHMESLRASTIPSCPANSRHKAIATRPIADPPRARATENSLGSFLYDDASRARPWPSTFATRTSSTLSP